MPARELRYTEVRPAAYERQGASRRHDQDDIDTSVLYPDDAARHPGLARRRVRRRAVPGVQRLALRPRARGRRSAVRRRGRPAAGHRAARRPRSAGWPTSPGIVGVFIRPNPTEDWKPFNHEVYDPIWQAAADTGLPLGLHPFLAADLPGACLGLRINRLQHVGDAVRRRRGRRHGRREHRQHAASPRPSPNPVDMMTSMTFLLAGGVCERFPDLQLVFLEANGGWIVPWLERLDHHAAGVRVGRAGADDAAVGVLPAPVLDQLRPRRVDARVHRRLAVVRRRPHHLGVATTRTPTPSSPASPTSSPRPSRSLERGSSRRIAGQNAVELYGLG